MDPTDTRPTNSTATPTRRATIIPTPIVARRRHRSRHRLRGRSGDRRRRGGRAVTRPSAGRSATPTRRCGARSSSRRWSGRTSTTTRCATPTGTTRTLSIALDDLAEDRAGDRLQAREDAGRPAIRRRCSKRPSGTRSGFEIIDCVFPDWKFQPADFVAARGLHAALVVGEPVYVEPEDIAQLVTDWRSSRCGCSGTTSWSRRAPAKNALKSPALCVGELGRGA